MPDKADEILAAARVHRPRPSRAMWTAALVIGGLCAIGFVVVVWLLPSGSSTAPHADSRGGSPLGFFVGIAVGVGVGYAIGRQRQASHSDRNKP
jgi:hypothetical protein